MKYDVFISYSRKDIDVATRICKAFDKFGITYFIDLKGIGGGFEFPDVLAHNIVDSTLFLFLASEHSYKSKFTTGEITFAFNKKAKNSIIPYIIDGSTLPLNLEFIFASINWRTINEHPIETTLVLDILKLLGRECEIGKEYLEKRYKVGDYYDDGKKQGVVFEVSADGKHGKIVSLTESSNELRWSSDSKERNRLIGADDKMNGANNMAKVKAIAGWREKYPAFVWCADLGEGWYLPAIDELDLFTLNGKIRNAVNRTLATRGTKLAEGGTNWRYWSSTESNYKYFDGEFCMWGFPMSRVLTGYDYKSDYRYVRAVSAF